MAIYHCSCKIISRSSGRSAVGSSAYRAGERLTNDYDNVTHDYTKKGGIVYSEIMLSENAPKEYQNRETLWNAVEKKENAKNSQLAREYELALPKELSRLEQIKLVQDYTKENFINNGMCADIAIHDKKDGNPHVHIMLTVRPIKEGGAWGEKQKKEYILDKNGNKQYDKQKQTYKCRTIKTTNWDDVEFLEKCRENWAVACNREFERKQLDKKIDNRSFERQGIQQLPTIHLGTAATQMERRGIPSERGKYNEGVRAANNEYINGLKDVERQMQELEELRSQLNTQKTIELVDGDKSIGSDERRTLPTASAALSATKQQPEPSTIEQPVAAPPDERTSLPTAEQVTEKINSLKTKYINLEVQINRCQTAMSSTNSEQQRVNVEIDKIREISQRIIKHENIINQLQGERAKLGIFSGKQKKEIDGQISKIRGLQEELIEIMQQRHGIIPNQSEMRIKELLRRADAIEKSKADISTPDALKEQQRAIEKQYRHETDNMLAHPDAPTIKKLIAEEGHQSGLSLNERMIRAKAESRLNNLIKESTPTRKKTRDEREI